MKSLFLISAALAALTSLVVATPTPTPSPLSQQAPLPPDGTGACGKSNNRSCYKGQCCSMHGWCGTSTAHCARDQGCQDVFGTCNGAAFNPLPAQSPYPKGPGSYPETIDKCCAVWATYYYFLPWETWKWTFWRGEYKHGQFAGKSRYWMHNRFHKHGVVSREYRREMSYYPKTDADHTSNKWRVQENFILDTPWLITRAKDWKPEECCAKLKERFIPDSDYPTTRYPKKLAIVKDRAGLSRVIITGGGITKQGWQSVKRDEFILRSHQGYVERSSVYKWYKPGHHVQV